MNPRFVTSSHCAVGTCVAVARTDTAVLVRHSAAPDGPTLTFTPQEWGAFVAGVRNGEFDHPTPDVLIDRRTAP